MHPSFGYMSKPTAVISHQRKKFRFAITLIILSLLIKKFLVFGRQLISLETVTILTRQRKLGRVEIYSSSALNSFRMVD